MADVRASSSSSDVIIKHCPNPNFHFNQVNFWPFTHKSITLSLFAYCTLHPTLYLLLEMLLFYTLANDPLLTKFQCYLHNQSQTGIKTKKGLTMLKSSYC